MALSVALPSFDAFLRSARRSPAVLPRAAPTYYAHSPAYASGFDSPVSSSSYSSMTPPGSPYYGHFVSLSPTSSPVSESEVTMASWRLTATSSGSEMEDEPYDHYPATRYQDMLTQPCVAIAPRPRNYSGKTCPSAAAKPVREKKKYLKERQRCEIVRRVRAGEKQAHLAKEFGVSRAAVCYLLKHEYDILRRSALRQQRRKYLHSK